MSSLTESPTSSPAALGPLTELQWYWISIALSIAMLASIVPCVGYFVVGCCVRPCVVLPCCDRTDSGGACKNGNGAGADNAQSSAAWGHTVQTPGACAVVLVFFVAFVLFATAPLWLPIASLVLAIRNGALGLIVLASLIVAAVYAVIVPSFIAAAFAPMCCAPHPDNFACESAEHKAERLAPALRAAKAKAKKAAAALAAAEKGVRAGSVELVPVMELVAPAAGSRISHRIPSFVVGGLQRNGGTAQRRDASAELDPWAGQAESRASAPRASSSAPPPGRTRYPPRESSPSSSSSSSAPPPGRLPRTAAAHARAPNVPPPAAPAATSRAAPAAPAAHAELIDQLLDGYGRVEAMRMYAEICRQPNDFADDERPLIRRVAAAELATLRAAAEGAAPGECSFMYRYILRESCSQFDLPSLTSLTISL